MTLCPIWSFANVFRNKLCLGSIAVLCSGLCCFFFLEPCLYLYMYTDNVRTKDITLFAGAQLILYTVSSFLQGQCWTYPKRPVKISLFNNILFTIRQLKQIKFYVLWDWHSFFIFLFLLVRCTGRMKFVVIMNRFLFL